jgi:hypothetical protein
METGKNREAFQSANCALEFKLQLVSSKQQAEA